MHSSAEDNLMQSASFAHFRPQWSCTLTLDQVIWHTVMYHSSTTTYITNLVQIAKVFCAQPGEHRDQLYYVDSGEEST